jgi:hypothetical protein
MTTSQLILMTSLYLAAFVGVAYFTRAKVARIAGALCGGAVFGVVTLLAVAVGETQGCWRVPKAGSSHFQLLLWVGIAFSCTPVYLITWRVARRFGGRGLAVLAAAAAVIGPLRDLPGRRNVPRLDRLLTGPRAGPRRCHDLCITGGGGARSDAYYLRPSPR